MISETSIRTDDKSLVVALTDHIIFAYKDLSRIKLFLTHLQ